MPDTSPRLPFEIDDAIDPTLVTGRAGVPLVIELFRQLGVAQAVDTHVAVKQRQRGLPPSQLVESLVALWTSGGDRCQDLTTLREDQALATLLGYPLPAATTVRDFLEAFHVEDGPLWVAGPAATVPLESAPLAGLGQANRTLVAGVQRGARAATATLDVDATLVESHKDAATVAYDGTRGYQPVVVLWAEHDVIVHDQFRDGQVPAGCGNVRVLEQAVANLPQGVDRISLRADSALYETEVLRWCEEKKIAYAISADMSAQLQAEESGASPRPPGSSSGRSPRRSGPGPKSPTSPRMAITGRRGRAFAATSRCVSSDARGASSPTGVACSTSPWSPIGRRMGSRSSGGTGRKQGPSSTPITSSRPSWRPPRCPVGSSGRTPPGSG